MMEVFHTGTLCICVIIIFSFQTSTSRRVDRGELEGFTEYRLRGRMSELKNLMFVLDFQPQSESTYQLTYYSRFSAKEELDNIVQKMLTLTRQKKTLVEKLRKAAEENYKSYDTNQSISCSTFTYDRAKAITSHLTNETRNPTGEEKCQKKKYVYLKQNSLLYNLSVNIDQPTAHVPTNVYDGSKTILMVANWTESLDTQLKENLKENPTLKFQYFASSHGMFKIFPAARLSFYFTQERDKYCNLVRIVAVGQQYRVTDGVKWHIQIDEIGENSPVDFFDCRSQTWFIEAATFPKDIVILVDKSGSMKGRRETIANLTVFEILTTLTENDFFNVLLFNQSIYYADPIFSNILLQATLKNKQRIMDMMNITPSGIADYGLGLRAAFELLKESRQNVGASSDCSQAIMIISDGAPDSFESLFEELNPEKDVRVFTYMIGQEASDRDNVQKMACNNRGFFVQIAALADVKENVQTYLPVMARTNALNGVRHTVWTGVHESQIKGETFIPKPEVAPTEEDILVTPTPTPTPTAESQTPPTTTPPIIANSTVKKKKRYKKKKKSPPITIFTSVAQAVYDMKEETAEKNFGNMIGVTGLDVPVSEFEKLVPPWKYGVNGYVFAINNNGYVLFHPKFRPVYKDKLKPFYQNVDIAEVEQNTDMTLVEGNPNYNLQLRKMMIDRLTSTDDMEVFSVPDDFKSVYTKKMEYFFKALHGTPFSIGLALPWESYGNKNAPKLGPYIKFNKAYELLDIDRKEIKKYFKIDLSNNECSSKTPAEDVIKIIPYEFCNFNEEFIKIYLRDPTCAFVNVLFNETLRQKLQCDEKFLKQIYADVKDTHDKWKDKVESRWTSDALARNGIEQIFMIRYSGLYRVFNLTVPSDPDFVNDHLNGIRDSIFQATHDEAQMNYHDRKDLLHFHVPSPEVVKRRLTDNKEFSIIVTSAINMHTTFAPVGIVGFQLAYSKLKKLFKEGNPCYDNRDNDCYLLTSNGFVLASLRDEDVGKSFGEVDCEVLKSLMDRKYFINYTVYDFQAVCTYPLMDTSFGVRLIDPITRFIGYCIWLTYSIGITIVQLLSSTFWGMVAAAQEMGVYQTFDMSDNRNSTEKKAVDGDPELVRRVERQVNICRNHTDEEDVMKCFQDFLNTLCRRVGPDSNNDCITACKSLRKFSPDHWNAHEKCVYPSKPCSKEYSLLSPTYARSRSSKTGRIYNCCPRPPNHKQWNAAVVDNTNLLVVSVFPTRSVCRCRCSPPFIRSQELTPVWSNTTQPYRRQPDWKCTGHRKENDSVCSNDGIRLGYGLLLIQAMIIVIFVQNR